MNSELLEVAILGKTIGLKGALKLHNRSDFPDQFKKGAVFIDKFGNPLKIKSYNLANSSVIFENFEDINLAKTLVNTTIFRSLEDTKKYCKFKKDEYLYCEIIGNLVYEGEILLGKVVDILESGSGYILGIQTDISLTKDGLPKEFYIPYLDNFILSVDLENKKILAQNSLEILKNS